MAESKIHAYLNFPGNAREAMEFYQSVLGGNLSLTTFGDAMPMEGVLNDAIMHATLENGFLSFMASDTTQNDSYVAGTNFSLSLSGDNEEELSGFFAKLAEGGKITMPLEKAPWGDMFGMLTDKFSIGWMVNITGPKETPPSN
jgi:PhnB protein